jgi:hypothetical protein
VLSVGSDGAVLPGGVWVDAANALAPLFDNAPFELRFSLDGRAAVRALAPRGAVARRHAEPADPDARWSARAECGRAAAWLVATAPPRDAGAAGGLLQHALERHTALTLERLAELEGSILADLLERLTHQLRTDVSTLRAVAEGGLADVFAPDERAGVRARIGEVGEEAQRRLSAARDVMSALDPGSTRGSEPVLGVLEAELVGAGVDVPVSAVAGEAPMASVPGAGWSACACALATALARDERLAGAPVAVRPDPAGWAVTAGDAEGLTAASPWTEEVVGQLAPAGAIVVAAGGFAEAGWAPARRLRVRLTVPAAPSE